MASFWEEYRADFSTPIPFVLWCVLTVVFGLAGPFGSYMSVPVLERLLFWAVIIFCAIVIGSAVRAFVHANLGLRSFRTGAVVIAVLICILFTPPLYYIIQVMFRGVLLPFPSLSEVGFFTFCVSLGVGAFRHSIEAVVLAAPSPEPTPLPRLMQRIDPDLHGDLISISVRDHYVDVLTSGGRVSLLMRLSDAMAEAEGVAGAQVHRSHWVAWDAVTAVVRAEGRLFAVTSAGGRIPVSRNHKAKLEERGLI